MKTKTKSNNSKTLSTKTAVFVAIIALALVGVTTTIAAYTPVGSFLTETFAKTPKKKSCPAKAPKCAGMTAVCYGDQWKCVKNDKVENAGKPTATPPAGTPTPVARSGNRCTTGNFECNRTYRQCQVSNLVGKVWVTNSQVVNVQSYKTGATATRKYVNCSPEKKEYACVNNRTTGFVADGTEWSCSPR